MNNNNSHIVLNPWVIERIKDYYTYFDLDDIVLMFSRAGLEIEYEVVVPKNNEVAIFYSRGNKKSAKSLIKKWENKFK